MPDSLAAIRARLRAADRALARVQGGSSELALVREAAGSLLAAVHELVDLCEKRLLAPGGLNVDGPFPPPPAASAAPARARGARR